MGRRYEVGGGPRILNFGVSGKLYNSNILLYDRETYSLWSQLTFSAVTGPMAGTPFLLLPSDALPVPLQQQDVRHGTWRAWRRAYPGSLVLARDGQRYPGDDRPRDYERDPYSRVPRVVGSRVVGTYDYHRKGTPLIFEPRHRPADSPLDDKARVLGILFPDGTAKAYPLEVLARAPAPVTDTVAGTEVVLHYVDEDTAYATTPSGRPVRAVPTYWFAWYAFYPETELYWPER